MAFFCFDEYCDDDNDNNANEKKRTEWQLLFKIQSI